MTFSHSLVVIFAAQNMAVYKRGGVYHFDFWFKGERHFGTTRLKNRRKAELAENKLKSDLAMGEFGLLIDLKPAPTLKEFIDGPYLKFIRLHSKDKPKTVKFYEETSRRLLEYEPLAIARLTLVSEKLIEDFIQWRSKQKRRRHGAGLVTVRTINAQLSGLRRILALAEEWKHVNKAPKIRPLPGETKREYILNGATETKYLEVAEFPMREAATLMLDTGVRPDECVRLKKADIAPGFTYLVVKRGKTEAAARAIPVPERSRSILKVLFEFFPDSDWVFPGRLKGQHLTIWALEQFHRRIRTDTTRDDGTAFFPKTFVVYSLRHTFGTRLGESGADPYTIMRLMGHSSIEISKRYVHPTPEHIERAMARKEALDKAMRKEAVPTILPTEAPESS